MPVDTRTDTHPETQTDPRAEVRPDPRSETRGRTGGDSRTADEIERDIERKRAALVGTVGEIQDRISPERIVSEVVQSFREHGGDMGAAVARSVKQNPVALALTGVGLAWLIFGRSHDDPDETGESRSSADARFRHHTPAGNAVGGRSRDPYRGDPQVGMAAGAATGETHAGEAQASGRDAAAGQADYYAAPGGQRYRYDGYPDWARVDLDEHDDEWDEEGVSLGERASDAASEVGSKVKAAGTAVADGARDAASAADDMRRRVADRAARMRERLARGTEDLSEDARERVIAARRRAVGVARRAEAGVRRGLHAGRDAVADVFEDQPLVVGALAMAVGAAIGGALPRTRQEDELLGAARDDLFTEAERLLEEERRKAGRVVSAAVDEAGQIADEKRRAADEAAPGSASAAEAVADEVRSAGERIGRAATSKAEEEKLGKPGS